MQVEELLINRVAASGLVTFNLEELRSPGERVLLDIKDQLFQGLILREKDFRAFIKDHNWQQYTARLVAITCSTDAIVPTWAYLLLAAALQPYATFYLLGSLDELELALFYQRLAATDWQQYRGQKVVLKGCGTVPPAVYVQAMRYLLPVADKLMFGEPCSTVPLYKRPAAKN